MYVQLLAAYVRKHFTCLQILFASCIVWRSIVSTFLYTVCRSTIGGGGGTNPPPTFVGATFRPMLLVITRQNPSLLVCTCNYWAMLVMMSVRHVGQWLAAYVQRRRGFCLFLGLCKVTLFHFHNLYCIKCYSNCEWLVGKNVKGTCLEN